MYGDITYEKILGRMLERIPGDLDKREGSVIFDALAPAAVELQNAYIGLGWTLDQMFAGTAVRESLIRRCAEWGISPHPATKAALKGVFNMDIELGARFSLETLNYTAVERLDAGVYRMECETAGTAGNKLLGKLVPIGFIQGLTRAELTEVLEEGSDEEPTEALLERFLLKVQKPSTSGNRYDYYNWAVGCPGVGAAKVFPLADGPGTVKVVVANANRSAAGEELLRLVADTIEELRPIGADVSVVSAAEKRIAVSAKVKIKNGVNLGTVQAAFAAALTEFLQDHAFDIAYVSLARVGNLLLNVAGVEDFTELLLNGQAGNVALADEEIAVAGTVSLGVM
ncbi:baseplate J/gp47 family protein [Clostridium sp. AN503]|uniref:baseplate J/gp47 family protein n=1 Tax=Clostridium sp. AN503 TaxID=3160598 RepID=UPI0034580D90